MNITDYIVVEGTDLMKFQRLVLVQINEGYVPQGGVAYYHNSEDDWDCYVQAMIKEES